MTPRSNHPDRANLLNKEFIIRPVSTWPAHFGHYCPFGQPITAQDCGYQLFLLQSRFMSRSSGVLLLVKAAEHRVIVMVNLKKAVGVNMSLLRSNRIKRPLSHYQLNSGSLGWSYKWGKVKPFSSHWRILACWGGPPVSFPLILKETEKTGSSWRDRSHRYRNREPERRTAIFLMFH